MPIQTFKKFSSLSLNRFPLILLMAVSTSLAASEADKWSSVKTPSAVSNKAQSIGAYTAGCLDGAVALPENGTGFQLMRLSRKRFFGHPELKLFIENLGLQASQQQLGTLLIGDLGQARGGPTLSGHRSHQTGLDVDIWFLRSKQANTRLLSFTERETWNAPSVVQKGLDAINFSHWSVSNEKILKMAARMPEVDRIFVHPSIKQQLCKYQVKRDWLRKIRPWWKHDDHFHVRLKCPAQNIYCQDQEPLPAGDGCDASLAWWFSAEAKAPAIKKIEPEKPTVLPILCQQILNN
jgi:penicillin-insensitive murein endopeptidase